MDGLLVIDKPSGPTSHDIVAAARRGLNERRIGHTGTLDPMATGVLPLVIGKATRLSRFLTASDKTYEAVVRLGVNTDTADAKGRPQGDAYTGPWPSAAAIEAALDEFRGTYRQQPPAFSAKKIEGRASHRIARAHARKGTEAPAPRPEPATVTVHALDLIAADGSAVTLRVSCSAGFYVRTLAADLGARLGTGGHLEALRRTRSGAVTLAAAVTLGDWLQLDAPARAARVVPVRLMLPDMPAVRLSSEGVNRAVHGQPLGPAHVVSGFPRAGGATTIQEPHWRMLDGEGELVGIAEANGSSGLLHPAVVLM